MMDTAIEKVRLAEDGWNSRDPAKVALAYTVDSYRPNRAEFVQGREAITAFLKRKRELDYRLVKELRGFRENRMAVRFAYEWHDDSGNWFRFYGNENWEFDANGLMQRRFACISVVCGAALNRCNSRRGAANFRGIVDQRIVCRRACSQGWRAWT